MKITYYFKNGALHYVNNFKDAGVHELLKIIEYTMSMLVLLSENDGEKIVNRLHEMTEKATKQFNERRIHNPIQHG